MRFVIKVSIPVQEGNAGARTGFKQIQWDSTLLPKLAQRQPATLPAGAMSSQNC